MSGGPTPVEALRRVMGGGDLTQAETEELFGRLMDGELSDPLKAGLLVALAIKGETAAEVAGAVLAMRRRSVRVDTGDQRVVDTCGTGGDGKGTFNISTAAALVAAAAGVPVAKHGNRSVSSRSGSADVLAALGVRLELDPEQAARALRTIGITFLYAPLHHPAMREVMPVRRALAVRTLFNLLGPLTNPAGARRQVIGVYGDREVDLAAGVLALLEAEHALVVHGEDGLDELTTTGSSRVAEVRGGAIEVFRVAPESFGIARARPADLGGGTPEENARRMEEVLAGAPGALADVVALNAGAAVYVGGLARDLAGGVARARAVLAAGAAAAKLDELRRFGAAP